MNYTLQKWLHGLGSAAIGGGANAVTLMVLAPLQFNLQAGWKDLLIATLMSGLVNAAFYLKQSPLPPEDTTTLTVTTTLTQTPKEPTTETK